MGTESARMIYGSAYLDSPDSPPPLKERLPADGDGGGTFNHGFLLQMNGYVSGAARGRDMLKEGLELQRKHGHCCRGEQIETFSASHGQLNEAAAAVSIYHAVRTKDGPMIELLRDWWWSEMVLCEEHAIPGRAEKPFDNKAKKKGEREPDVWGGGWRAMQQGKLVGANPCRDLCWRLSMGHPVPKPGHKLWGERYYLAARALKMLPEAELKALRPAPGFQPPLPYTLVVERWEDGSFEATWNAPDNEDTATEGGWSPTLGPWLEGNPGLRPPAGTMVSQRVFPGLRALAEGDGPA
jgi:hypothetical protein